MTPQTNRSIKPEIPKQPLNQTQPEGNISLVLFKDNTEPRAFSLPVKKIVKGLYLASGFLALLLFSLALTSSQWLMTVRAYNKLIKAGPAQLGAPETSHLLEDSSSNDTNTLADRNEQLEQKIKNLTLQMNTSPNLENRSSILSLFSSIVTDKTKEQDRVSTKNFSFALGQGKELSTLTFELHNNHPDAAVEKGYIVVLKKEKGTIYSYPTVFNEKGTFLLDFEKGESFQVSRFRLVNAQFDLGQSKEKNHAFQVLIFRRNGELLLNLLTEVTSK